ncbi:hypothetical protein Q4595_29215, partial [Wenyingzhuangia sp. 1_MG-2023]|nr:hypothetical protein [Wenyingzhuangia sp. 1_MG-2023]
VGDELECLMLPRLSFDGLASDEAVLDNALELFDTTGKMIREVRDAIDDGRVDDDEWRRLEAASNELQRALAAVLYRCDQLRG